MAKPTPRSASQLCAPVAAESPKAEPPESTMACTSSTMPARLTASVSRVPGPPPRASTAAMSGRSASSTVTPEPSRSSWALPTRIPATSEIRLRVPVMHFPVDAALASGPARFLAVRWRQRTSSGPFRASLTRNHLPPRCGALRHATWGQSCAKPPTCGVVATHTNSLRVAAIYPFQSPDQATIGWLMTPLAASKTVDTLSRPR